MLVWLLERVLQAKLHDARGRSTIDLARIPAGTRPAEGRDVVSNAPARGCGRRAVTSRLDPVKLGVVEGVESFLTKLQR